VYYFVVISIFQFCLPHIRNGNEYQMYTDPNIAQFVSSVCYYQLNLLDMPRRRWPVPNHDGWKLNGDQPMSTFQWTFAKPDAWLPVIDILRRCCFPVGRCQRLFSFFCNIIHRDNVSGKTDQLSNLACITHAAANTRRLPSQNKQPLQ